MMSHPWQQRHEHLAFLSAHLDVVGREKGEERLKSCQQSNIKKWSLSLHDTQQ
jgi:hypothetical protein